MDDLQQYSLESMTNVSSLVPMTKATLSGRQPINQLLHQLVNSKTPMDLQPSGQATPDSTIYEDEEIDVRGNNHVQVQQHHARAITQAEYFESLEQKAATPNQSGSITTVPTGPSFRQAFQMTDLIDHIEDPRDQLVISKDHAIPKQPLRLKNVLAPRFEPLHNHAQYRLSKSHLSHLGKLGNGNKRNSESLSPTHLNKKKPSIINVEVIFDNRANLAAQQPITSRSRRDTRILTLRSEATTPSRIINTAVGSQDHESHEQQRQRPQLVQVVRQHSNQQSVKTTSRDGSQRRQIVKATQAAESTPRLSRRDNLSDNNSNNGVIIEARDEVIKMEAANGEPQRKIITVEMGKTKPLHNLKSDPLKQQEVRHTYFKREQNTYSPLAKYVYDGFGTMVNKQKRHKKPTVQKFISKANEDLQNQIRNQRDFLLKVMGDRLQNDYSTDEYATLRSRSKSPMSSPNQADVFTLCPPSKTLTPRRANLVTISKNSSIHRSRSSSNESLKQGGERKSVSVMKQLFEKMQWEKVEMMIKEGKMDHERSRWSEPGVPIRNLRSDMKDVTTANRQNSAEDQQLFLIGQSFSKSTNMNASFKRMVPNSQVPNAVRPRDRSLDSEVMRGKMISDDNELGRSQSIERDMLVKMKEFEQAGQELLAAGEMNPSQLQSPAELMPRPDSINQSNFFESPETSSAVPFDTFGVNERKPLLNDKARFSGQQSSNWSKKDEFPPSSQPFKKQLVHRVANKSPSPFLAKQHAKMEIGQQEPITHTSRMIVQGVAAPPSGKRAVRQINTLPISPRSVESKDHVRKGNNADLDLDDEAQAVSNGKQEESIENLATRQEGMRVLQSYVLEDEKLREAQGDETEIEEVNKSSPLQQVMRSNPTPQTSNQEGHIITQNGDDQDFEQIELHTDDDKEASDVTPQVASTLNATAEVVTNSKIGVYSTQTLLQGAHSTTKVDDKQPKKPDQQDLNLFSQRLIQESASTREVNENVSFNLQKVQIVQQQQSQGKLNNREVYELKLRQQSTQPPNVPSTQYQISLIDSEMKDGKPVGGGRMCIVRFMFTRIGHMVYDCEINLSKIVNNLPKPELTADEFQHRCLKLVVKKLAQKHKIVVDINDLMIYDLEGQEIHSIIDWLQRPLEAQLSHFIILVVEKMTDVGEALKFFDLNRPISASGSELAELMKPVHEVLELFKDDANPSGVAGSNYIYANQSFAGLRNDAIKKYKMQQQTEPDFIVQGTSSTLQSKRDLDMIKVVKLSQEANGLVEDSLWSCSQQRSFGDDFFPSGSDQTRYGKRANRIQLAKHQADNGGPQRKTSYVNVMEESPGQNLINSKFYQHVQEQREGSKDTIEGGYRKTNLHTSSLAFIQFSQMNQKSQEQQARCTDFSNYVCQQLLSHMDKPSKVMSFEQKMSNPASAQVVQDRVDAGRTQRNAISSLETPHSVAQSNVMKQFLEDYYKKPMAMSAMRQSFSDERQQVIPSTAVQAGLKTSDSLFSATMRHELPQVMRLQTGFPQSLRDNNQSGSRISRNIGMRLSTLTQPQSKHQVFRGSIDATNTNSTKVGNESHFNTSKRSSRQGKKSMLSTWNGTRNSVMTTAPATQVRNATIFRKLRSNLASDVYEVESNTKVSAMTSRCNQTAGATLQTRFSLPVESTARRSSMRQRRPQENQGDGFVPARAIKVPLQHKFYMKKNEDFSKMKNLFLANCLKLKDGEMGQSDHLEQSMSNRIKAFRGGLNTLAPIKQGVVTARGKNNRTTTL